MRRSASEGADLFDADEEGLVTFDHLFFMP